MSQGRAGGGGVAAGQATIVWDDFGRCATVTPVPLDFIESDRYADGQSFAGTFAATTAARSRQHHDQLPDGGLRRPGVVVDHRQADGPAGHHARGGRRADDQRGRPRRHGFPLLIAGNATSG